MATVTTDQRQIYYAEMQRELLQNILPFYMNYAMDHELGGFYGRIDNDRTLQPMAPKGQVQHSRLLWSFAHAYRKVGDEAYRDVAAHAYRYLRDHFWDQEMGGLYWMVDAQGRPFQTHKLVYGQAFGIYGLAEYYLATGEQESLETAVSLYQLLEQHSTDKEYNGYWEAHERDWRLRADNVDEIAEPMSKTMNTHLHLIEAYTNLLRAWPDAGLKARLRNLIDIAIKHIINPETHHFWLHFKRTWQPLHQGVSYGHDIEGSWLLLEAVELLDEPALHHDVAAIARRMAQATYNEGLNPDGSLREGRDDDRIWWVQAEAMVGFLNAYQMTGSQHFWDASWQCWQYTKQAISDPQYGEWLWGRSSDGQPLPHEKAGPWKTAYHNGRACLEIMHRLHAA